MGMRILLIHQYFLEENDAGGSRWNEISKSWKDLGHDVEVIAGMMHANGLQKRPEYKGKFFISRLQNNIKIYRTHVSESYNSGFFGRLWGYFSFMLSSLWAGLFKVRGKYDFILVTSPPLFVGVTGYILSRLKRIPLIFEIRDLWPESAIDTGVLTNKWIIKLSRAFEAFIYKKAKRINVLTPAFYNTLLDKKGVPAEKLMMISNAADFALSDGLLKNFDSKAFRKAHLLENHFVIVLFLLIGQGMEKERLVNDTKRRGLKNIRFLDSVPKKEVFKYILASDMGASILKRVETFKTVYSNKTFDYFSCKKPVLMAIDGVSRQLVEDAKAGSYVEPENTSAYNLIIREYLNDPSRLLREGENGYNYAKTNYDRQVLSKRYIDELTKSIIISQL